MDNRPERQRGITKWMTAAFVTGVIALAGNAFYYFGPGFSPALDGNIRYYGVALTNGQMFYGSPESVPRSVVVLTNAYYVVRQAKPQTKEVFSSPSYPAARTNGTIRTR